MPNLQLEISTNQKPPLWWCDFLWRLLIGPNFFIADLAYLSNSKTFFPLVKFWSGHYFNIFFSKNLLLRPIPPILFSGISWKLKQFVWLAIQLWIRVFPFLENTFLSVWGNWVNCTLSHSQLFCHVSKSSSWILRFLHGTPSTYPGKLVGTIATPKIAQKGPFLGGTKNQENFCSNQEKF